MRRLVPGLAAIWLVAQLGPDGVSERCWVLRGVTTRPHKPTGERYWLSQADELNGWLQRIEVARDGKAGLDAAAREVGLPDASRCAL